jgi:undecaprenyl-diphosphatase
VDAEFERSDAAPLRWPPPDSWLADLDRVDSAVYGAVAGTPTPRLDDAMRRLARAADYSRLSLSAAAILAVLGGERGRRAANSGLASLGATTLVVNALFKPLGRRRRPEAQSQTVPQARRVRMPGSRSFPSGHTAAAFAFAAGVGRVMPSAGVPLYSLAALVGYSRVHTGVHYPGDVLAGALVGVVFADMVSATRDRRRRPAPLPRIS